MKIKRFFVGMFLVFILTACGANDQVESNTETEALTKVDNTVETEVQEESENGEIVVDEQLDEIEKYTEL